MLDYFVEVALFNAEANEKVRKVFEEVGSENLYFDTPYQRPYIDLAIHIFAGVDLWLERIAGKNPATIKTFKDFSTWEMIKRSWTESDARLVHYVHSIQDEATLNSIINYTSLEKQHYQMPIGKILMHISHHAMYHRGQLATLLRIKGLKPLPDMDLITYYLKLE